jgi:hypothetical protein
VSQEAYEKMKESTALSRRKSSEVLWVLQDEIK